MNQKTVAKLQWTWKHGKYMTHDSGKTGSVVDHPGRGRPKKLTDKDTTNT